MKNHTYPKIAVDLVIFTVRGGKLETILIQMKKKPFTGRWAFPGGLIKIGETLEEAAKRELYEKTGLKNVYLEQLFTFSHPKRDPYSRVLSVSYFALISSGGVKLKTTSKYSGIGWFDVRTISRLAYDHNGMLRYAIERLRYKLEYTNVVYSLLPKNFTLSELQSIYEIILGKKLDKRNFRKKILTLGLLKKIQGKKRIGAHRPAQLYSFRERKPALITILHPKSLILR